MGLFRAFLSNKPLRQPLLWKGAGMEACAIELGPTSGTNHGNDCILIGVHWDAHIPVHVLVEQVGGGGVLLVVGEFTSETEHRIRATIPFVPEQSCQIIVCTV